MAYDGIDELDMVQIKPLIATLPLFETLYHGLEERDQRDPASWRPRTGTDSQRYQPRPILFRPWAYEDVGGRNDETLGDRRVPGVQIESVSMAVEKVWSKPPAPFKGTIIAQFHTTTFEEEKKFGEVLYPFRPANVNISIIFVNLRA
ncbi:hypothetical protein DTO012A7_1018 [Penicillium roqueforti]|nr:hypothetical protein CBS147372_4508 [Penicillium roqueforti]KAI3116669.1 hypothetical protein CBS147333_293 [Penicillium roqueforti]KAI3208588.1 hypothetical protein CBS147311_2117 [Penicillium roqueforti]KAI3245039.1 hypothetical protein DTO012A7_1018 [Penicillium roqueforti]KAI3271986.1 hypothetical protein CBS147308_4250 [Penicillium roqueforti]